MSDSDEITLIKSFLLCILIFHQDFDEDELCHNIYITI